MDRKKCDKKVLLDTLLSALSIARSREIRIRLLCDTRWIEKLKLLSSETLMKKFRYVLGNCSFSTIYAIYRRGFLSTNDELLKFVASYIKKRNLEHFPRAAKILRG